MPKISLRCVLSCGITVYLKFYFIHTFLENTPLKTRQIIASFLIPAGKAICGWLRKQAVWLNTYSKMHQQNKIIVDTIHRLQCDYSTTVLQYYSTSVLQYYSIALLQNYSTTVLQYYSITVLQYYSITVLKYYNTTV